MRGNIKRVLPSLISIGNNKCRVFHKSQELACSRCRYLGHSSGNTEACDAHCLDPNLITIHSAKDVLCNFYPCDVHIYDNIFRSSEHHNMEILPPHIYMAHSTESNWKSWRKFWRPYEYACCILQHGTCVYLCHAH